VALGVGWQGGGFGSSLGKVGVVVQSALRLMPGMGVSFKCERMGGVGDKEALPARIAPLDIRG